MKNSEKEKNTLINEMETETADNTAVLETVTAELESEEITENIIAPDSVSENLEKDKKDSKEKPEKKKSDRDNRDMRHIREEHPQNRQEYKSGLTPEVVSQLKKSSYIQQTFQKEKDDYSFSDNTDYPENDVSENHSDTEHFSENTVSAENSDKYDVPDSSFEEIDGYSESNDIFAEVLADTQETEKSVTETVKEKPPDRSEKHRSETVSSETPKSVTPETAKQMKKASFIQREMEKKTAHRRDELLSSEKSDNYSSENKDNSDVRDSDVNDFPHITDSFFPESDTTENPPERDKSETKTEATVKSEKTVKSDKKEISPEQQEQFKKAAYLKRKLQGEIYAPIIQTETEDEEKPKNDVVTIAAKAALAEISESGNEVTEKQAAAIIDKHGNRLSDPKIRKAYEERVKKIIKYRRQYDRDLHRGFQLNENASVKKSDKEKSERESKDKNNNLGGAIQAVTEISEIGGAVNKGAEGVSKYAVSKFAENALKKSATGKQLIGISDKISAVKSSAERSDSVGGAVTNTITDTVSREAGQAVTRYIERKNTEARKVIQEKKEKKELRKIENRYGINLSKAPSERKKYRFLSINKADSDTIRKRKAEKFSDTLFKRRKEAKRAAQEQIIQNGKKRVFMTEGAGAVKAQQAAKAAAAGGGKAAVIGGGAVILFNFLLILVLIIVIMALLAWASPYSYTLAGQDGDEPTEAVETSDILNGYALMIQNYMDVAQAEYYVAYSDWYGGTYVYPSPSINFSDFYTEYRNNIIEPIQDYYMNLINSATNPAQISALYNAMSTAISNALANCYENALTAYNEMLAGLDDTLTGTENRKPYEITRSEGGNGISDNAEFNGKPIVGTNHFGNADIQSDLSAEELVAMAALYKSLKLAQTNGEAEGGEEYTPNITPEDIMTFLRETEYIPITTEITHDNACAGMNCKRRLTDSDTWEYYCDSDHDNLSGQIDPCLSKEDLIAKIMELTEAEEHGFNTDSCNELYDSYIEFICKELDISEEDYRHFGADDNERAEEFYQILIDPDSGEIPNNFWEIDTPFDESE